MKYSDCIFWNVDTQFDFVSPQGKLYVPGAELLKSNWKKLTQLAKNKSIVVVNTCDWHFPDSEELSANPDFVNTFPQHCMANTAGADFIEETNPENPSIIDWKTGTKVNRENLEAGNRNLVIRKDAFDVFTGNPFTERLVKTLSPKTVIVYGVTTNVCVNDAVLGLAERTDRVIVVQDAIKELPNIPLPFKNWENIGVKLMSLKEIESLLKD